MSQSVSDYYDGSRIFSGLSNHLGISVDKVNFVISQIVALLLASLFRTALHPSKASAATRHTFGLVFALFIGYFCFGTQAIHLAALPAVCFIVIRTQNPEIMQRMVLAVALFYLSIIHMHRQIYDYGSYNLDITGPLMVITQKVTSLAFHLHDGLTKNQDDLTKSQRLYAVTKLPSALEYFSFTLHFPSLMAGPVMFYKDYIDFIDGTNLQSPVKRVNSEGSTIVIEPSPLRAVYKKVILGVLCAIVFVKFLPMFPITRVKEDDFVENTSLTQKLVYLYISTSLIRFKYYFAWILADAVCINAGIGYNGVDEKGVDKWDKFTNVDILGFEFATNLRDAIGAWNLGTNRWLRMVVYERVKGKYSMILTYTLSAIWHGFYPGYYLTFASGALFTHASRIIRRRVRNYFLGNPETKFFYDGVTFITTRILMAYMVFTFALLEFWPCIRLYTYMYWCVHIGALVAIFVVPVVIPKTEKGVVPKNSIAEAFVQARPLTNGVSRHHD